MNEPKPEPGGERRVPPPKVRTALAAEGNGQRGVALHLVDKHERRALTSAFGKLGWQVHYVHDELDVLACGEPGAWADFGDNRVFGVDLLITDDPGWARKPPAPWDVSRPCTVVLVDNRESAVAGAWDAGADWVLTRPLDLRNPLGW